MFLAKQTSSTNATYTCTKCGWKTKGPLTLQTTNIFHRCTTQRKPTPKEHKDYAEDLKYRLHQTGLTIEDYAFKASLCPLTLRKILNGTTKKPHQLTIIAIERVFNEEIAKLKQMRKPFEYKELK